MRERTVRLMKLKASCPHAPWSSGQEALFAGGLFLLVLALYSLTWFHGLHVGVSTIGGERVLRGEIPYRDFWTMYAPGHFYLLALLFRLFGTHVLVESIATSVLCATTGLLCYSLVLNLNGRRLAAIVCMGIFLSATQYAGYFRYLGSYPPAILSILAGLNFIVLFYQTENLRHLLGAGLATGAAVAFKHDIGGYTAIAVAAGLLGQYCMIRQTTAAQLRVLFSKVIIYAAGIAVIVVPIYLAFAILAGKDLLQDLVIFPLTDFRFARPEHYPGLLELNISGKSFLQALSELFEYFSFTFPFIMFVCGLIGIGAAALKKNHRCVALGITFSAAYLLHYTAAHVQINTHIISMSLYGSLLGVLFFDLFETNCGFRRPTVARLLGLLLAGGWILSLVAKPIDEAWAERQRPSTELKFEKVSGVLAPHQLARSYSELLAFVDAQIPPDANLFVGLHRHDVVVVGANAPDYFILDRPIATRYHEIHPAVVDTAEVQREIIQDLRDKNVPLIILKQIKSDDRLDFVKRDFRKNLPHIGATDLDKFIRDNYVQIGQIGNNLIWKRKDAVSPISGR